MKNLLSILSFVSFLILSSCSEKKVEPIHFGKDQCELCKMGIEDAKFGTELITEKGRVYKFDDIQCMVKYHKENSTTKIQSFYIHDFNENNSLIAAETAHYIKDGEINSPMRGNIIATQTKEEAQKLAENFKATATSWSEIIK